MPTKTAWGVLKRTLLCTFWGPLTGCTTALISYGSRKTCLSLTLWASLRTEDIPVTLFHYTTPLQRLLLKSSFPSETRANRRANRRRNCLLKAGIASKPPNPSFPSSRLALVAAIASLCSNFGRHCVLSLDSHS